MSGFGIQMAILCMLAMQEGIDDEGEGLAWCIEHGYIGQLEGADLYEVTEAGAEAVHRAIHEGIVVGGRRVL